MVGHPVIYRDEETVWSFRQAVLWLLLMGFGVILYYLFKGDPVRKTLWSIAIVMTLVGGMMGCVYFLRWVFNSVRYHRNERLLKRGMRYPGVVIRYEYDHTIVVQYHNIYGEPIIIQTPQVWAAELMIEAGDTCIVHAQGPERYVDSFKKSR